MVHSQLLQVISRMRHIAGVECLVVAMCCRHVSVDFAHDAGNQLNLSAIEQPPHAPGVAAARTCQERNPQPIPLSDCLQVRLAPLAAWVTTLFDRAGRAARCMVASW
jgi:hypothetical protein